MRISLIVPLVALGGVIAAGQQSDEVSNLVGRLFPSVTDISTRRGADPPHFKVFGARPGSEPGALVGFAFWTTELEPLERGYEGPIKVLVGMDTQGRLTGVVVAENHEPYGYFSIDRPEFAAQFRGKSIRDRFRVGSDVDAVARATITVSSATRAIKNSARRVARQLLSPADVQ